MFCKSISWFICIFVAVTIATAYSDEESNEVSHSEVTVHQLRFDNLEWSTAAPVEEAGADLGALLDAGEGAVVALVAGGARLAAHRAVLAARSAELRRALQDPGVQELAIPDVEGPVLRQLVAYLYTLRAPRLPGMAPQLLAAADRYGLPGLKAACERQLIGQLSAETAAAAAVLAIRHDCNSLRRATVAYIRAHIFHVMATQGWADVIKGQPDVWIKIGQLLSELPVEPRSLSPEEMGVLLIEAAKEGEVGEVEALLAAGADAGVRDEEDIDNWTALHWAALKGHEEVVRRLLAAGAAVDARADDQWTPLHCAAFTGHKLVAIALLEGGADRAATNDRGQTPVDVARQHHGRQLARLLQEW